MRSVILQILRASAVLALGLPSGAQEPLPPRGGASIVLGGTTYAFTPLETLAGKPQGGIKTHILKLRGRFQPPRGGALDFEMQVTAQGQIYRMNLVRKEGALEVERWAATMKTQVKVLQFDRREGGTVKLGLSGPLSGLVQGQGRQETWHGELWTTLQSWPTP